MFDNIIIVFFPYFLYSIKLIIMISSDDNKTIAININREYRFLYCRVSSITSWKDIQFTFFADFYGLWVRNLFITTYIFQLFSLFHSLIPLPHHSSYLEIIQLSKNKWPSILSILHKYAAFTFIKRNVSKNDFINRLWLKIVLVWPLNHVPMICFLLSYCQLPS